ncbi:signal peptidase [Microbacterium ginsengiterrae]|uniref:Signal peptidase I n=1 Tax=Microbacterium ginsengiterrae TaxID=546115 RepID=A0A7W9CD82_9MICO|nr:signal peptidase I [Microbacterium ginsengiterrae]MBB5743434.1 signal peptidase [Microbacterium ginsengiterrae]
MTAQPRHARKGRRPGLAKDIVLVVAALLGLATVGWTVYAQVTGATIIVLKTGSMSPGMPQGSGALSMPADAAELEIGDVVSAKLDDSSPWVTHRIVGIDSVPGDPQKRELVLRGDANATDDLFPYTVEKVLRVQFPIPFAGPVLAVVTAPLFLGGLVLVIGLLVVWAFWPAPVEEIEEELALRHGRTERSA